MVEVIRQNRIFALRSTRCNPCSSTWNLEQTNNGKYSNSNKNLKHRNASRTEKLQPWRPTNGMGKKKIANLSQRDEEEDATSSTAAAKKNAEKQQADKSTALTLNKNSAAPQRSAPFTQ